MNLEQRQVEILHGHLFCGIGGGARGMNRGRAVVGNVSARFRCVGGVDVDPGAIKDFGRIAGVPGTVLDLFSREQVGSSRVDLQACKLEYSIVSPK